MSMRQIAVILGVGPGTGAAIARLLAPTHSLVLLSRSLPGSYAKLGLDLPEDKVHAASSDGSSSSLKAAMEGMKSKWPDGVVNVGVYNTNFPFQPGNFLDRTEQQLRDNLEGGVISGFNFAQSVLPFFVSNSPSPDTGAKGTLIFTGATMAMRGGAKFSVMAPGMFARRSLTQSLAREFGPQGIHVVHVIIDGQINTPMSKEHRGEVDDDSRMHPESIAKVYGDLINQNRSTWTQELDLRPYKENF